MIPIKDNNPTSTFPFVTILLIAVNLMVFIYQFTLTQQAGHQFVIELGAIPHEITRMENLPESTQLPPFVNLITCMFLHGGILHILGNMLYLWIFGNNIEDACGHLKFIFFYLICGLIASGAHIISDPGSTVPMIGASGAIAGVLGAYLLLYPRAKILTVIPIFYFIRIVYVPAYLVLGFWFLIQLFRGFTGGGGGVAWFAHIGGFVAGLLLIKLLENKSNKAAYGDRYSDYI